jgi:exodeoxyribonuclease VII small subunit
MSKQSFEKAMNELEEIVGKLEKGGLPLNESLELFEKGVKLARFLRQELEKAEKKIEILLKENDGEAKTEPFDIEGGDPEKSSNENSGPEGELPF